MKLSTYFSWTLEESKTLPGTAGRKSPVTLHHIPQEKIVYLLSCFRSSYISEHFEELHVNGMSAT